MNELDLIWAEQVDFNKNFRKEPSSFEERSEQTSDIALGIVSEVNDLLRATKWRKHRREVFKVESIHAVRMELADIFKYWVTLCQIWGVGPEQAIHDFWEKSMVVRHRWCEEWVTQLAGSIVLVDIDGVLCDYWNGFLEWARERSYADDYLVESLRSRPSYLTAESMGMTEDEWRRCKSHFRSSGAKRNLPVLTGARKLLEACRRHGWTVVLVTARPIESFPNIYADTLVWLKKHQLPFDFLWWVEDRLKAIEIVRRELARRVVLAIDDDPSQIKEFAKEGVTTLAVAQPYFDHSCTIHFSAASTVEAAEIVDNRKWNNEGE